MEERIASLTKATDTESGQLVGLVQKNGQQQLLKRALKVALPSPATPLPAPQAD